MSKCFCHFNGYEVKDAKARKAIEEILNSLPDSVPGELCEQNNGICLKIWVGTTEEYNNLPEKENNCIYFKTDDDTVENLEFRVNQLYETVGDHSDSIADIRSKFPKGIATDIKVGTSLKGIEDYQGYLIEVRIRRTDDPEMFICRLGLMNKGSNTHYQAAITMGNSPLNDSTTVLDLYTDENQVVTEIKWGNPPDNETLYYQLYKITTLY